MTGSMIGATPQLVPGAIDTPKAIHRFGGHMGGTRTADWGTFYVTGGGSGIGRHLAGLLAARGAAVAVFDRRVPADVRHEIESARSHVAQPVHTAEVDVCDAEALAGAVAEAVGVIGPPRLAINSAGVSINDRFAEARREDFERTVAVNLFGSRNFAAAVLPHMGPGARLGLISSLAGITGGYTYSGYAASKAGVIGLARALRLEYAPEGIGVSVICPPEIMTPMVRQYDATMHPATRALKDVAGTLPIDAACREMLDGLARGRFTVIPGAKARRAALMTRLLPERVTIAVADRIVAQALKGAG
jgi:NAD(P)-dependent dehydrogenase (short-subunit alcohol dehydrogenase family)